MDFDLTEEQKMLKTNARDFLEKEIAPIVDEYERKGSFTREEVQGFMKQLMPLGYVVGQLPEEYGGSNLDWKSYGILLEELARVWGSLAGAIFIQTGFPRDILEMGTEEQKKNLVPRLVSAESLSCGCITEPNAGSDAAAIETTAVLDGDEWVINGNKTWISCGTIADIAMVVCVTDKSKGPLGISQILVDKEVSPFTARELYHLGCNCFPTAEIFFTDCRVPRANLLGDPSLGYKRTMYTFETARSSMAVMSAGLAQAAVDAAISYARERKQFGRPIGSFQMIQEMIVDMVAETEMSRLISYRALDVLDKGERCRWQSSLAKGYACEAAVRVASKAIQVHGAMGYSDEYPVERYFRDARMMTIPDGTTQIQKLVMGRELIGIRAFV
jgi:alkylation response protein AidB-like acyl-CoA dehydrogenase